MVELYGLRAIVDRVEFNIHDVHVTDERPFAFVYHISIRNDSDQAVTIKGRKWVVSGSNGHTTVYECEGVVSKFPHIMPGQKFQYESYHLVDSDSVAEGSYLGLAEDGQRVLIRIPPFRMEVPAV